MEQKPMQGAGPLVPPSAEVARLYLEEAQVVEERREKRIDRRAIAVQTIISAVAMALWVTAFLVVTREDSTAALLLTMLMIIWSQIAGGMAERSGAQWRMPGATRWYVIVIVVFAAAMLVSFFALLMTMEARPAWMYGIPGAVALFGFGGLGVLQLWRSRDQEPVARAARPPMPRGTRITSAVLGVMLPVTALAAGLHDRLLTNIVALVALMVVVGWCFAWSSDYGLAALGAHWRWPQFTVFALAAVTIVVFSILAVLTNSLSPLVVAVTSGVLLLLFAVVVRLGGRDTQEAGS